MTEGALPDLSLKRTEVREDVIHGMAQVKDTTAGSDLAASCPGGPSPVSLGALWGFSPGGGDPWERRMPMGWQGLGGWDSALTFQERLLPACQLPFTALPTPPPHSSASKAETTWVSCHGNCGVLCESQARWNQSWLGEGTPAGD